MNVTFRQVEVFLAVAELGSFTKAAERLKLAQPALSQNVRDLETELGLRLFDRTTRKVELTSGGREFQSAAVQIVKDLKDAVRNAHATSKRQRGRLLIATPPLLASAILPLAIVEFRALFPNITVEIVDVPTHEIVEQVRSGQVDCGLGTFLPNEVGIERLTLAKDDLMIFCAHDSEFAIPPTYSWTDLSGLPLIALTRESGIRRLVELGYEKADILMDPAFEVSQIATALAFVEAKLGFSVLPAYAISQIRDRKIVVRALENPCLGRDISIIHATGRSASPSVVAFQPIIRKVAREMAAALVPPTQQIR